MKITINPSLNKKLDLSLWNINFCEPTEPERLSVDIEYRSYSLVIQENGPPKVEIWEIDETGNLLGLIKEIELPNF